MAEREHIRHDGFLVKAGQVWMKLNHGNGLLQLNTDSVRGMEGGDCHLLASIGGAADLLTSQGATMTTPEVGWRGRGGGQGEAPDWVSQVGIQGSPFVLVFPKSFCTTL